jgi:3-phosphoshikimate 1-carboxyvinyltransferase
MESHTSNNQITISKSVLNGTITAPPSKSLFQRACAAAVLKQGATVIKNGGYSDDDKTAIAIIKQLGAQVVFVGTTAIVKFENTAVSDTSTLSLYGNESGLSSRMFIPIASTIYYNTIWEGKESLQKRPFGTIINVLRALGLQVNAENDTLPIQIEGNLLPSNIHIDGSESSQFITGILLAYSAFSITESICLTVTNPVSKPYIDLTLQTIEAFGLNVPENDNYTSFIFQPKTIKLGQQLKVTIEGDWSATVSLLVAGALTGEVVVDGIDSFTQQGDKFVLTALMDAGVRLSVQNNIVTAIQQPLTAFHYNAIDTPDAFPVLAALATQCEGVSVIEGVHRLIHKESNRANSIIEVLTQLGVTANIQDDLLVIKGKQIIKGGITLHSYNDHRIAMMITILGLIAEEPIVLKDAAVIQKSYPNFYDELIKIGANIHKDTP